MNNIILIGLPGAGKSTLGVILAKTLGMKFIDTDILIQERTGQLLQEIIDYDGPGNLLKIEENVILSLNVNNTIIATGGSVVYCKNSMEYLKKYGIIVYLKIHYDEMVKRLNNIKTRGIVLIPGQNLRDMYDQRIPMYEEYSDIIVDCSGNMFEDVVDVVVTKIQSYNA